MTFSLLARQAVIAAMAAITATGIPAIAALVPRARFRVGAITTQGFSTSRLYGEDGLGLLARGWTASETLTALVGRDRGRQFFTQYLDRYRSLEFRLDRLGVPGYFRLDLMQSASRASLGLPLR